MVNSYKTLIIDELLDGFVPERTMMGWIIQLSPMRGLFPQSFNYLSVAPFDN